MLDKAVTLRTSEAWADVLGVLVMDADGWDRQNFQYSWHEELISQTEFEVRLSTSTTLMKREAAPGERLVTFRTEGPGDEKPAQRMLEELDLRPVWIKKINDSVNTDWTMYVFTLSIPKDISLGQIKERFNTAMLSNPDYNDLHRCSDTLNEGIETNEYWFKQ